MRRIETATVGDICNGFFRGSQKQGGFIDPNRNQVIAESNARALLKET